MAELLIQATGHTLSWNDYKALKPASQEALYVGGGSMDSNDWQIPFVLQTIITKVVGGQNPEILTDLVADDFTVNLLGRQPKLCQILELGPSKRGTGLKVIVVKAPPHSESDLNGPWFLSVTVNPGKGQLSATAIVQVVDLS